MGMVDIISDMIGYVCIHVVWKRAQTSLILLSGLRFCVLYIHIVFWLQLYTIDIVLYMMLIFCQSRSQECHCDSHKEGQRQRVIQKICTCTNVSLPRDWPGYVCANGTPHSCQQQEQQSYTALLCILIITVWYTVYCIESVSVLFFPITREKIEWAENGEVIYSTFKESYLIQYKLSWTKLSYIVIPTQLYSFSLMI